jgi:hypothetical protein
MLNHSSKPVKIDENPKKKVKINNFYHLIFSFPTKKKFQKKTTLNSNKAFY